jgi:hypothetical protein
MIAVAQPARLAPTITASKSVVALPPPLPTSTLLIIATSDAGRLQSVQYGRYYTERTMDVKTGFRSAVNR